LICDTAGRLQNKEYLMKELNKMYKVIQREIPDAPHESLLVIDATTGQNGINQAKAFNEVGNVTGIILSKMDGTAKGGIILAIKELLNIPVKFIGLGESLEDLQEFDLDEYLYALTKNFVDKL
jgi:fused signal recognition particle receptor